MGRADSIPFFTVWTRSNFFSEPLLRVDLKLAYTEKLLVWLQFVKTDGQKSQVQKQLIN